MMARKVLSSMESVGLLSSLDLLNTEHPRLSALNVGFVIFSQVGKVEQ